MWEELRSRGLLSNLRSFAFIGGSASFLGVLGGCIFDFAVLLLSVGSLGGLAFETPLESSLPVLDPLLLARAILSLVERRRRVARHVEFTAQSFQFVRQPLPM